MLGRQLQRVRSAMDNTDGLRWRRGSRERGASAASPPRSEAGAVGDQDQDQGAASEADDHFDCGASSGASTPSRASFSSTSRASCSSPCKAVVVKAAVKAAKATVKAAVAKAAAAARGRTHRARSRAASTSSATSEQAGPSTSATDAERDAERAAIMAVESAKSVAQAEEKLTSGVERQQVLLGMAICGSLLVSWLVGALGGSVSWLLAVALVLLYLYGSGMNRVTMDAIRFEVRRVRTQRALSSDESAEWLNFLLNRWWSFSSNSLLALLKEHVEAALNEARPSFVERLEVHQLCLGSETPLLSGLRASELIGGRSVPLTLSSLALLGQAGPRALSPRHQVLLQGHVTLDPCEDFLCVLRSRLCGMGMGLDLDLSLHRLTVSGDLMLFLTLDVNAPFPHITRLAVTFATKPLVWFNLMIVKSVQVLEVPLLKTWLHSLVMDALMTSLVEPCRLEFDLTSPDCPKPDKEATDADTCASGVLTLGLSINLPCVTGQGSGPDESGARWLALTLGSQRRTCELQASPAQQQAALWTDSVSFLVSAAQLQSPGDLVQVKLKSKRLVGALTIAQYELALAAFGLDAVTPVCPDDPRGNIVVQTALQRKLPKPSVPMPAINVRLEYVPLPSMTAMMERAEQPEAPLSNGTESQGGVLYVVIHGAEGLGASDQSECNPYCMIFHNRQKVKTSHYLRGTTSPAWEWRTQLLVSDFPQTSLSFLVCSWSPIKMADTDLIGVAVLNLTSNERRLTSRHTLPLVGNSATGNIAVSVAFQPVATVSAFRSMSRLETGSLRERDRQRPASPDHRHIDEFSTFTRGKRNSNTWLHQAKMLLTHKDNDSCVSDVSNFLSNGQGLIEVSLIKARDLVAKDLNGFSDPYCEVKVNGECKYKTRIKKKTLNPTWEENTITGMPHPSETLDILIWDHDVFGMKDFLGSITFTCDEIRRCSAIDAPQWFKLRNTKSGSVKIRVKVISDVELESCSSYAPSTAPSVNSSTSSPRLPIKMESDRDSTSSFKPIVRRPSMERSCLKLHVDPPPPPPRTVTLPTNGTSKEAIPNASMVNINSIDKSWNLSEMSPIKGNGNGVHNQLSESSLAIGNWSPAHSLTSSPLPVPRLLVASPHSSTHSSPGRFSLRSSKALSPNGADSIEVNDESPFKKGNEYSSLRIMKQKVKQGLRLRRFRSEINFHEEKTGKNGATGITLSLQPRSAEEADASDTLHGEPLSHAVSQPSLFTSKPKRPTDLKGLASPRPDTYIGVEGKVLQAQGLHVAHVAQLYCRVKLQTVVSPEKQFRLSSNSATGKTVGKSRLLPAVPNPRFDLPFQLDSSSPIPRQAALLFEIRGASKDIVASRRITLQDLLSAAAPDTNEVHTWLALNNGASLEVEVAHGRELKKPSRKIFRSWSVHRIGKI